MEKCKYCVELTTLADDFEQQVIMLRTRNKILVTVVRALRDRLKAQQEEFDTFCEEMRLADEEFSSEMSSQAVLEEVAGLPQVE